MSLPHIDDLITDLLALQIENALSATEQTYLPLRLQSRAFLLSTLAQVRYLVHTWKSLKESCPVIKKIASRSYTSLHSLSPPSRTGTRSQTDNQFTIGVIGCGRMGRHIVNKLLQDPSITPNMILISTRQPDLLEEFTSQGVNCRFDNAWLANNADIIFLACLPSHLSHVVNDLYKSSLTHATLLVSVLAGTNSARVRRALNAHTNVMSVYFDWNELDVEERAVLSEDVSPEVRLSGHALCVSGCPFRLEAGAWFAELVIACLTCCAVHGVYTRGAGETVLSLLTDNSIEVTELIPGSLMEKRAILNCLEDDEYLRVNCAKLTVVLKDEKLRDILVEKYWQRVRENEPSLLDLARGSASNKSL